MEFFQKVKWKMMVQLSPFIICNNQGSARYLIFWHETPNMMAFCNIHCLRKSSRIIVIQTTGVNVLWDAIVPLSPTPTLIGSTICQTSKFIVFRNTSVVFLNINNKPKRTSERVYFIWERGVYNYMSFFNFLVLIPYVSVVLQYCFRHCAFCNLDWGITIYYHFKFFLKSSMILDLHKECTTINNFNLI